MSKEETEEDSEDEEQEEEEEEETEDESDDDDTSSGVSGLLPLGGILLVIVTAFLIFGGSDFNWFYLVYAGVALIVVYATVNINSAWEEAVILRLGKYNRLKKEGLFLKIPFIETVIKRDMRVNTEKLEKQQLLTKDNISVFIDAVLFLQVTNSKNSILNVKDYKYAMFQYAQTAMRTHIGQSELDELLAKREKIATTIKEDIDKHIKNWGIQVTNLEIQDISLPENMKRVMARQAEAEREKRGVIIASEGEVIAAKNLQKASKILGGSKFGIKLRELNTITDVSADGNTVVFYPTEMGMKTASSALSRIKKK